MVAEFETYSMLPGTKKLLEVSIILKNFINL